jgi:hypothetical protein
VSDPRLTVDFGYPPQNKPYAGATTDDLARLVEDAPRIAAGEDVSDTWPILPREALHGLAGQTVQVISPHSEADPAAILVQFLTASGNLLGPEPYCAVESTWHSLNLFAVLVGESSKARKGTSWGHIDRLFARVDPTWASARVTGGLSSAEGLIS